MVHQDTVLNRTNNSHSTQSPPSYIEKNNANSTFYSPKKQPSTRKRINTQLKSSPRFSAQCKKECTLSFTSLQDFSQLDIECTPNKKNSTWLRIHTQQETSPSLNLFAWISLIQCQYSIHTATLLDTTHNVNSRENITYMFDATVWT